MTDHKEVIGFLGTMIGMVGYVPYVRNILKGRTKPHAFSWFIWSLLTGIGFSIQWAEGAGPGSWVTGMTSAICFCVFVLALLKGTRTFPMIDWIVLLALFIAIGIWLMTDNPAVSIVVVASIDIFAYVPTIRKAFYNPFEETAALFFLDVVKWASSLFALEVFTFSTWFYPAAMTVASAIVVGTLLIRRRIV